MPILQRLGYVATLLETTAIGTENAPSASDAMVVYEADLQPISESTSTERQGMYGHMGQERPIPGFQRGSFKCKTYFSGSGTLATAPPWAKLMIGAGWQQDYTAATSVVFKPASAYGADAAAYTTTSDYAGMRSLTIHQFQKSTSGGSTGHIYKLKGAMGNSVIKLMTAEPATVEYDYKGCYVAVVDDQSISNPTFATHTDPKPILSAGVTFTPNGGSACTSVLRAQEFDMGCEVIYRTDANNASGSISALIVNRKPVLKFTVEDPDDTDAGSTGQDWFANFAAGTYGVYEIGPIGSAGSGNRFAINFPNIGFSKVTSKYEDQIRVIECEAICATNALATGDDEVTITWD